MQIYDIAIIGCGPAGLSAAIQLRRLGEKPIVFEASRVGGLLVNAHLVENYPGFPDGISGWELVGRMERHLRRHLPEVLFEEVTRLDIAGHESGSGSVSGSGTGCGARGGPDSGTGSGPGGFHLRTSRRDVHCRIVLIASGTKARVPEGLSIPDEVSRRVFSEVYPIRDVRGKRIVIVGSGDAAFDYALGLVAENRVILVSRSEKPKCLPLLRDRAREIDSIEYYERTLPVGLESLGNAGIGVRCEAPGGHLAIEADYLIFAIGREPRLGFVTERLVTRMAALERDGLLHLIGDVGRGIMRQSAIAAGDGVRAAIRTHWKLVEFRG